MIKSGRSVKLLDPIVALLLTFNLEITRSARSFPEVVRLVLGLVSMLLIGCAAVARRVIPPLWPRFRAQASGRYLSNDAKGPTSAFRVYRYVVDVHGQLFIHDTVPKNLTSCFKNAEFLDFFFKRIRPNPEAVTANVEYLHSGKITRHDILGPRPATDLRTDWSDVAPFNGTIDRRETRSREELYCQACKNGNSEGYEWISPCGPELNLVRCQDTPIVYRELVDHNGVGGMLKWAGSLWEPFQPDKLIVDPSNGYVYHPCPQPSRRRRGPRSSDVETEQRYGGLSLLGSNLVLSQLAEGLEIDPDAFEKGLGGSIEWKGERFQLGLLGTHGHVRK